jgi:hypothetical protein
MLRNFSRTWRVAPSVRRIVNGSLNGYPVRAAPPPMRQFSNKRYFFTSKGDDKIMDSIKRVSKDSVNVVKQESEQMMNNIGKNQVVKDISELLNAMEKRRYNLKFIGMGVAALTTLISYNFIKGWTSEQATAITIQMLDDEEFNEKIDTWIQERGEVLVHNLTQSSQVQKDVTDLLEASVIDLTNNPQVEGQIQELFIRIFKTDEIGEAGSILSSQIVETLAHDPEYEKFREQIIIYAVREIKRVADDGEVQGAISDLIWNSVTQIFTGKVDKLPLSESIEGVDGFSIQKST